LPPPLTPAPLFPSLPPSLPPSPSASSSYGVVYLGIDKATGVEVAVKAMLKQRPRSTRERTLKKLVREAALTARVQACEGVVKLLGAYEDADRAYLVMERLRGGDLEAALERGGPLPERAAASVARDVLRVIAACHASGCMHGDVKPANFVLREPLVTTAALRRRASAGPAAAAAALAPAHPFSSLALPGAPLPPPRWLVAIDFGCSQPVGRASLTRRTGTPVYMAPEVFRRDYGPEADLWSAGVMLYQLLTGRFPWWPRVADCRACTVDEVMRAVLGGEVPYDYGPWVGALPPAGVAGSILAAPPPPLSPECHALVRGLLTRDPARRLTAEAALASPWFAAQLGAEECAGMEGEAEPSNNVVPMGGPEAYAPATPPAPPPPPAHHHHHTGSSWFGVAGGGAPAAAPTGTAMA